MHHTTRPLNTRRKVLLLLLAVILLVRLIPHAGELYALYVYPHLSKTISLITSVVPFSIDEWIVIVTILSLIIYPFVAIHKAKTTHHICAVEIEVILWIIAWFYIGWGMNYYRDSFFTRLSRVQSHSKHFDKPTKAQFQSFLLAYTDSLNTTYTDIRTIDREVIITQIKHQYLQIPSAFGLTKPTEYQLPKAVAFNRLYSSVGVLGYMGPFADESHLNTQLFPIQYAFTYAHELAHLLSVSSEAEANYWAYTICTHSTDRAIRYSGYYGIMPNVFRNARDILTPSEFKAWRARINPRIIQERLRQQSFWQSLYSPILADIQDVLFNALLKSNHIPDGTANYDKVILMILATPNSKLSTPYSLFYIPPRHSTG